MTLRPRTPDDDELPNHLLPRSMPLSRSPSRSPSSPPQPILSSSPSNPPLMSLLLPLLLCPLCDPPRPLQLPITLHCGHTVCAVHIEDPAAQPPITTAVQQQARHPLLPSCPLPSCNSGQRVAPQSSASSASHPTPGGSAMPPAIPSTSRVVFLAPRNNQEVPNPQSNDSVAVHRATADVALSKVLALVARHSIQSERSEDLIPDSLQRTIDEEQNSSSDEGEAGDATPQTNQQESRQTDPSGYPYPRPATRRNSSSSDRRARKRPRRQSPENPPPRSPTHADSFSKELLQELTCEICYMLIYKPVTTPCQHTFCAKCLLRSLDHNDKCPLCRQKLPGYSYFHDHPVNKLVLSLILVAFPTLYDERGDQIASEDRDARLSTPIFVCQLSFPGMPTLLHFFEPRYRLMLRRCLEQPMPCFGMIMPPQPGGMTEYGTMLEIRSVQMLPDGRSMVETWGARRFRILERGHFDGYMVGRIEAIEDFEDELESEVEKAQADRQPRLLSTLATSSNSHREPTNAQLVAICHKFVNQLRSGMAPWVVQRLNHTYGPMPSDISNFTFWMGLVLPIDEHEKAKLLPIRSPRLRLRLLVHWIEQLNNQWWFMNGCIIA